LGLNVILEVKLFDHLTYWFITILIDAYWWTSSWDSSVPQCLHNLLLCD